jgi:hypothetical protein
MPIRPRSVAVLIAVGHVLGCSPPQVLAEIEACHATPEAERELALTADQQREFAAVYASVESMRQQVDIAREQRRALPANAPQTKDMTQQIIDLERQCRERVYPALKAVLSEAQYEKILLMEENHRKRVQAQQQRP